MSSPTISPLWTGSRGEGWVVTQSGLILLYLLLPLRGRTWPTPLRRLARVVGAPVLTAGGLLLVTGGLALGRQITPLPYPSEQGHLVVRGPYRYVRHPMYSGLCLGALGFALLTTHSLRLVFTLLLALFFDAKARREEDWLIARYPDYLTYRQRVRRLIPGLY